MWYLKVLWLHDFADEPVELLSEIGPDGYEMRKVERYRDGRLDFADETREPARLSSARVRSPPWRTSTRSRSSWRQ